MDIKGSDGSVAARFAPIAAEELAGFGIFTLAGKTKAQKKSTSDHLFARKPAFFGAEKRIGLFGATQNAERSENVNEIVNAPVRTGRVPRLREHLLEVTLEKEVF